MKSVFKNPKLKAQQSRNAFDRGAKSVLHAPFGMLLPCYFARVAPDDYVELSAENQCICEPLARPAFMRLKEHIDYFFVPFSQLYTPFENLVTAQDNYFSDSIGNVQSYQVPNTFPMFNGNFLREQLMFMGDYEDVHGFNELYGSLRLLDLLGYGNYYAFAPDLESKEQSIPTFDNGSIPNMNLFNLLAYQKIYYDYFRNPKYEVNVPSAYNIDRLVNTKVLTVGDVGQNYYPIFQVHYRWLKKDYFMSVQPSIMPISSTIGYSGINTNYLGASSNFEVPGISPTTAGNIAAISPSSSANPGQSVITASASNNNLTNINSVQAIRLNFALDKIARRQREAGAQFDKQMLAQFGITPVDERHGKCVFIGGQTNRLYASDVTNTSETGESGLGALGGQINVYSPSRRTFKYHVKEHGIIMGIYSTSVENDYASFMISRDNTCSGRFDYFNPALDKLGLQPIFRHELSMLSDTPQSTVPHVDEPNPRDIATTEYQYKILGYVRRYMEYKTNIDSVHGLFASQLLSADDAAWVTKYKMQKFDSNVGDYQQLAPLSQATLTFNPQLFNDVAKVAYNGQWNTDHFKINHYTHAKVISNMDVIGEDF